MWSNGPPQTSSRIDAGSLAAPKRSILFQINRPEDLKIIIHIMNKIDRKRNMINGIRQCIP